jgi:hypothetical protein
VARNIKTKVPMRTAHVSLKMMPRLSLAEAREIHLECKLRSGGRRTLETKRVCAPESSPF